MVTGSIEPTSVMTARMTALAVNAISVARHRPSHVASNPKTENIGVPGMVKGNRIKVKMMNPSIIAMRFSVF